MGKKKETKKETSNSSNKDEKKKDGKLGTCKEVHARHILYVGNKVPTSEFGKLAQEYSDCSSKKKGGDLGWFGRGKMVFAFQEQAFSTLPGDTTDVFKTQHGYHIILVEGRRN
eukprot:gene767-9017_t